MRTARVSGVGMTRFTKVGRSDDWDVMAEAAIRAALKDAGIGYEQLQQAYAGYVYADSTAGQSALYRVGCTGIPIFNVNNNCASGSTALFLANQAITTGAAECVLAVGFEQMTPGAIGAVFTDRVSTMRKQVSKQVEIQGWDATAPFAAQQFGGAGVEYQRLHGTADEVFGLVSVKARRHAANNPNAIFREPLTLEEVMASPHLYGPLTRLQACPPSCGAAAAVFVSPAFAQKHNLDASVEIVAQAMTTDYAATFDDKQSMLSVVGYS